jgi:hypothetical protein
LLGLFKPGRQHQGAEFRDHGPEAGGVLGLHGLSFAKRQYPEELVANELAANELAATQAHRVERPQWSG